MVRCGKKKKFGVGDEKNRSEMIVGDRKMWSEGESMW